MYQQRHRTEETIAAEVLYIEADPDGQAQVNRILEVQFYTNSFSIWCRMPKTVLLMLAVRSPMVKLTNLFTDYFLSQSNQTINFEN